MQKGQVYTFVPDDGLDSLSFMLRNFYPSFASQLTTLSVEFQCAQAVRISTIYFFIYSILRNYFGNLSRNYALHIRDTVKNTSVWIRGELAMWWHCSWHLRRERFSTMCYKSPSPPCRRTSVLKYDVIFNSPRELVDDFRMGTAIGPRSR
jgi:hypothetical protein